jgi:hypothetical protein
MMGMMNNPWSANTKQQGSTCDWETDDTVVAIDVCIPSAKIIGPKT